MMYSFPTEVVVTMEKVEDHPSPPEEFRKKMMPAVKDFFGEKLEEEPWSNLEATLWYVLQGPCSCETQSSRVQDRS